MKKANRGKESLYNFLFGPIDFAPFSKEAPETAVLGRLANLNQEITRFGPFKSDSWLLKDAVRGALICGTVGSGKTSGSGRALSKGMIKAGYGGLVLCVKADEASEWETLVRSLGREKDLVRVTPQSNYRFNFLDAEKNQKNEPILSNITHLFSEMSQALSGGGSKTGGENDSFWSNSVRSLISHAIAIEMASSNKISLVGLSRIIHGAVKYSSDLKNLNWPHRLLHTEKDAERDQLIGIFTRALKEKQTGTTLAAISYFTGEFAELSEKTRSIIITYFSGLSDELLREPLSQLFCNDTTISPEDTFKGKIIIVDIPVHTYQRTGKLANLIWKKSFQLACKRRTDPLLPVFLWCDEAQYLIEESDGIFQTTSRANLCCSVYLTQNIQNFYSVLGNQAATKSLLGCLNTKIFHQNSEQETNEWASQTIGNILKIKETTSTSDQPGVKKTVSKSKVFEADVHSSTFSHLKSGGKENNFIVEGIVHIPGKKFSNSRKSWKKVRFSQKK